MPTGTADAFTRSVPARREVVGDLRREVVAFARGTGADEDTCQRVALAVAEAINNAVIHAYLNTDVGPVAVEAWSDRDAHLHVRVCDEGVGMVPRPDSPGLGLGLPLMAQMADDLHVATRDESGTMVSLRFTLRDSRAGFD